MTDITSELLPGVERFIHRIRTSADGDTNEWAAAVNELAAQTGWTSDMVMSFALSSIGTLTRLRNGATTRADMVAGLVVLDREAITAAISGDDTRAFIALIADQTTADLVWAIVCGYLRQLTVEIAELA